jgi:6-phosphofructokinase 1
MAAGAHVICIPEVPMSIDDITELVTSAHDRGRAPLVVVSEGFKLLGMEEAYSDKGLDAFNRPRLGGIGDLLAPEIERITGIETRATILGHIQRGGSPSAFDRVLATRLGLHAADAIVDGAWGQMVAMQGTDIVRVPFADALGELNTVPRYRYDEAAALFG